MAESELNVILLAGRLEVRGTSNYTLRLAERLPEFGVKPTIVCSDVRQIDWNRLDKLTIHEYRHLEVPVVGRVVREWIVPALDESPPDLVHVQSRSMLATGVWLAKRLKVPLVLTIHDFPTPKRRVPWNNRLGRRIISVSDSVKAAVVQQFGVAEEMVTVIHSGVEATLEVKVLPVLDPGHVPVVGMAGPLESVKGVPYFLSAAKKVLQAWENVEFLIAGAGPEEYNLRRLARELEVDRHITFVPRLREFTPALAAMDIFCLPSLQQGLGSVMLEAMALGKPVIATGVGGVYSVIRDNETGLLIPPSESQPLADRILELLNDPVRARSIGEAGRALVRKEFRVETMVAFTASIYREVVESDKVTEESGKAVVAK